MASQQTPRRLAVLGCGFMGTAILQGLLSQPDSSRQWTYTACVRNSSSVARVNKQLGTRGVTASNSDEAMVESAAAADVVVLGCSPGDVKALLSTAGLARALQGKLVVSLLAGVSTDQLRAALLAQGQPEGGEAESAPRVARVMPSIGAQMRDSVTLIARARQPLAEGDERELWQLFSRVGSVLSMPESLMHQATAIGAACHALSIQAVDAVTDAGVAEGMDRPAAAALAAQCLRSSSGVLCSMSPEQLKTAMSTPQGITINSVLRLQANGVPAAIADSVRHAVQYARSM